jgi:hypothetical protein
MTQSDKTISELKAAKGKLDRLAQNRLLPLFVRDEANFVSAVLTAAEAENEALKARLEGVQAERDAAREALKEERTPSGALAVERGGVPEGWVLAPREPTDAMLKACGDAWTPTMRQMWPKIVADLYRAMLSAVPATPEGPKEREPSSSEGEDA